MSTRPTTNAQPQTQATPPTSATASALGPLAIAQATQALSLATQQQAGQLPSSEEGASSFCPTGFSVSLQKSLLKLLGSAVYSAWFRKIHFHSFDGTNLTLSTDTEKSRDCITLHYIEKLEQIAIKVLEKEGGGRAQAVSITIASSAPEVPDEASAQRQNREKAQAVVIPLFASAHYPVHLPTDVRYSFDSFIASSENSIALQLAKLFSEKLNTGNPMPEVGQTLFIHGSVGNGKTHLVQSLVNSALGTKRVLYTTAEHFMLYYINSIKDNKFFDFQRIFLNIDALLIDDLHFVCKKKGTVDELYKITSSLHSRGKCTVFSATSCPSTLPIGNPEFASLLKSSTIAKIEMPNEELRHQILSQKAKKLGYAVPDSIIRLIAAKINSNIRELEGMFNRVVLNSQLLDVDISFGTTVLRDMFTNSSTRPITPQEIQKAISAFYAISMEELISSKRTKRISLARQVAMYLASKLTSLSYVELGKEFGGKKHSTIIHAVKTIKSMMKADTQLFEDVERLKLQIQEESSTTLQ